MNDKCCCSKCFHPVCPPVNAEPPFTEVSHEIGDTSISIKVPKKKNSFDSSDCPENIDVNCTDIHGKKCREGCMKVNVIPNEEPPPKKPEEAMFLMKASRQITASDDQKNSLELEFRLPRNYLPIPEVGPFPIIVPRMPKKPKKKKAKKKGLGIKKKKTK